MAITSEDNYYSLRDNPSQRLRFFKTGLTIASNGRSYSSWRQNGSLPDQGAVPTTNAIPTSATTGAIPFHNSTTGTLRLLKMSFDVSQLAGDGGGMITIVDRLAHCGGLSGTNTSAQSIGSASLTRYTSGVGVCAGLEIYTAIGGTPTTATLQYTNQAGTNAQVSPAFTFGGSGNSEASRITLVPLASGDTGVRLAENVDLVASTGTAGDFGVTLFHPLVSIPVDHILPMPYEGEALYGFGTWFPEVKDDACLQFIYSLASTTTGNVYAELHLAEDI